MYTKGVLCRRYGTTGYVPLRPVLPLESRPSVLVFCDTTTRLPKRPAGLSSRSLSSPNNSREPGSAGSRRARDTRARELGVLVYSYLVTSRGYQRCTLGHMTYALGRTSTQYRAIGRYIRFYVVYVKSAERTRPRLALARQCNSPFLELSLQGY